MRVPLLLAGALGLLPVGPIHATPSDTPPALRLQKTVEAHAIRTRTLVFDDKGTILVSGGSDRRLRVWDARTLRLRSSWSAPARERYKP